MYGREDFDAETMVQAYRRHNAEVLEYFRGRYNDYEIIDMDEGVGWNRLCNLLDTPIPKVKFPHERKTSELVVKCNSY
jgi:hypothetical protein